jgi:hypothetical protein
VFNGSVGVGAGAGAGGEGIRSWFAAIRAKWISCSGRKSTPGMRVAEPGAIANRAGMRYRKERMATMVVVFWAIDLSINRVLGRT